MKITGGTLIIAALLLTGCAAGTEAGSAPTVTATVTQTVTATPDSGPAPTVTVTATETVPGPETTVTVTAAAPTQDASGLLTTFGGGTWVVGEDIAPGTYKLTSPATETCYWGIYRSGTNQDDIVANDIVTGGLPRVTLKKGQDFESDCGEWARQR